MLLRLAACVSMFGTVWTAPESRAFDFVVNESHLEAAGMFPYWRADLPIAQGDTLETGYLVDSALYVVTEGGTVFALTAAEGLIRWADKVTDRDYVVYRPTHSLQKDGTGPVIIPTTSEVLVYNRFSGDLLQRFRPEFPISGPAVGYNRTLFMGSSDARFYSILRWNPATLRPMKLWEVAAGGPVSASPVLYGGGLLLFASQSGAVHSCFGEDKALNWTFTAGGPVVADMAIDDKSVYVASTNRSLYKIDLGTGRLGWRFRMPRPLYDAPVVAGKMVFQFCETNGVSAIDIATGREKWRVEEAISFVNHSPGGDFLLSRNQTLLLVDHDSGKIAHTIGVPGAVGVVRNTVGTAVYVLGRHGEVICLQLDDVPYLRRQQVAAARARLHLPPQAEKMADREKLDPRPAKRKDPFRSPRDDQPD